MKWQKPATSFLLKGVFLYVEQKNVFTVMGVASVSADGQMRIYRCQRGLLNESQFSDGEDPGKMREAAHKKLMLHQASPCFGKSGPQPWEAN